MNSLSIVDYVIIISCLTIFLLVGLLVSRMASQSLEHYFLGGRNLSWWMLGFLGMNTWFDLTGTMIITSLVFLLGFNGYFLEFRGGVVLPLAFVLAFTGKWFRRSGCMTAAEWTVFRFGSDRSAEFLRFVTAFLMIVNSVLSLIYMTKGVLLFMGVVIPLNPLLTALGILVISSVYTVVGGFYATVVTDIFYGIVKIVGCILIGFLAWKLVPDSATLSRVAEQATGNPHWITSHPKWEACVPPGYEAYKYLFLAAFFYFVRSVIGGLGAGADQRIFAARTPREASLQCFIGEVGLMFRWPLIASFAILGLFLVNDYFPDRGVLPQVTQAVREAHPDITEASWHQITGDIARHPETASAQLRSRIQSLLGENWRMSLPMVGYYGTVNPEMILPGVIMGRFGSGVRGLIVVTFLCALMGSFSSNINGAASFFVRDIYQNFLRPMAKNRELMVISYVFSILLVLLGLYLGMATTSINSIWSWIVMGFGAGSIIPSLLRLYWWRTNAWGVAAGLFSGAVAAILQRIIAPGMTEIIQLCLVGGISTVTTVIVSLWTKPTDSEIVRQFYLRTRPFGSWKPFSSELSEEATQQWKKEHRNDIISVCITMVWQISMFLVPMQLIAHHWEALQVTCPVFLLTSLGMYLFWWKNLPRPDEQVPDFDFVPPGGDVANKG